MPTFAELLRAVLAVRLLLGFDARAILLFERTPQAAWHSFIVLPLLIPVLMVLGYLRSRSLMPDLAFSDPALISVILLQYLLALFGFYLVLDRLTRAMGCRRHLPVYICVQNWVSFPVLTVVTLLEVALFLTKAGETSASAVYLLAYSASLFLSWQITLRTLGVSKSAALALCALELLFNQLVGLILALFIRVSLSP